MAADMMLDGHFVYFVRAADADCTKIGCSSDPQKRLLSLQRNAPVRLTMLAAIPGTVFDERDIHKRFAKWRRWGEWFKNSNELTKFIQAARGSGKFPAQILTARRLAESQIEMTGRREIVRRIRELDRRQGAKPRPRRNGRASA